MERLSDVARGVRQLMMFVFILTIIAVLMLTRINILTDKINDFELRIKIVEGVT